MTGPVQKFVRHCAGLFRLRLCPKRYGLASSGFRNKIEIPAVTNANKARLFWMVPDRKRKLVYGAGENWKGWCCQACGWNRPLPQDEKLRDALAREVKKLFDAHSCEAFGTHRWKTNA
jgi:hypothetical protein